MALPRIPPPFLALALALATWLAAAGAPASPARTGAALVLFALAGAFGLPVLRAFRTARTTIDPVRPERASALVTGGIYRRTRNPMYVSPVLMLGACALWLGGGWPWVGPVALWLWLDRLQIPPEERAMGALFGDAYTRYRQEVRRWL